MVDLSEDMRALLERLGAPPADRGRCVQFLAARPGEGTSAVARAFAFAAAERARRGVWLVELDPLAGVQFAAIAAEPVRYGDLGEPRPTAPPTPDGAPVPSLFHVEPPTVGADGRTWPDAAYLDAYPVGERRLWLARFRREALRPGQRVELSPGDGWWRALAAHADWVVVDAPAFARSRAGIDAARAMDATFLVVSAEAGDPRGPTHVRDALAAAGGHCPGVVLNRAPPPLPRALQRFAP